MGGKFDVEALAANVQHWIRTHGGALDECDPEGIRDFAAWLAADRARVRAEVLAEVREALVKAAPRLNAELRPDGTEDPVMAAYIEGFRDAWQTVRGMAAEAQSTEPLPDARRNERQEAGESDA